MFGSNQTRTFGSLAAMLCLVGGCSAEWGEAGAESSSEVSEQQTAQARQAVIGGVVADTTRPEVGRIAATFASPCTATLIHSNFLVTDQRCLRFPAVNPADNVVLTRANGVILPAIGFTGYWMRHPGPNFTIQGTGAVLNNDIAIMRLAVAPAGITPAQIATNFPADGTTVSHFGYGMNGANCLSPVDGHKRVVNFAWGAPPYPSCPGDLGGPIFNQASPNGDLIAVSGGALEQGSLVHYRERLWEEMRRLENPASQWLAGTFRGGQTLSNATAADASTCSNQCMKNPACKGWNLSGTTCTQMSYVGKWIPASGFTSGLPPPWKTKWSRDGGTLLEATAALSPGQCAHKCGLNEACAAFTHTTSSALCSLYSTVAPPTTVPVGTSSGVKTKYQSGVNLPGDDILPMFVTTSANECSSFCNLSPDCQSYTWVQSGGQCWRKYGVPHAVPGAGMISDWKRPPRLPNTYLEGTPISGVPDYQPSPLREETCRADCENIFACQAYSIKKPGYGSPIRCRLMQTVTAEIANGDWDSNWWGLTYF